MKLHCTSPFLLITSGLLLLALEPGQAFSTSRKILEVQQRQFVDSLMSHNTNAPPTTNKRPPQQSASSPAFVYRSSVVLSHAPVSSTAPPPTGFIDTELRGAAMRLHTTMQAPKEGKVQVQEEPKEPYVPNHSDYLHFLVDSQHVYQALEEIVNEHEALAVFRNTGLERTQSLETDIAFMMKEYNLERPPVGSFGTNYATLLRDTIVQKKDASFVPEFMCHYYNFYFAHTAGGRMIGKKMSSLLLNKKTLEFYKVRFVVSK